MFGQTSQQQQQQPQSTNLFGHSTSTPASGGLFGQTSQGGSSLFGQPKQQSSGLFGQTAQQSTSNLFGQSTNQQQQPQQQSAQQQQQQQQAHQPLAQSFFGAASVQPQFSWSRPNVSLGQSLSMPTFNPQPGVLAQSTLNKSIHGPQHQGQESTYGPGQPASITDQLQKIKDAWDPTSEHSRFQACFYNRVDPGLAALYTRPPNFPQALWEDAVTHRPDDSVVPVLASGFNDLDARAKQQATQIHAYRVRIHEIADTLKQLQDRHSVHTQPACVALQRRQGAAQARLLALATRVQVLKSRGYALRPEEATLRTRLETLRSAAPGGLQDPATFGRLEECRAKLVLLKQREQQIAQQTKSRGYQRKVQLEEEQLGDWQQVLQDAQAGLQFLTRTLKEDIASTEEAIQQHSRS
jgi:nuclear pore complex protein Nup54